MAELSIKVGYKTPILKTGYVAMCILFPIWTILLPASLGVFIAVSISAPHSLSGLANIGIPLILISSILLSLLFTALTDETHLTATKEGVSFPLIFLPRLGFRRQWRWTDLRELDVSELRSGRMNLIMRLTGKFAAFDLGYLKNRELEEFLLAADLWGPQCQKSADLLELQKRLQRSPTGELGYTKMWEDELNRRFHATAFIPLEVDCTLQRRKYKIIRQLAFGGLSAIYLAQKDEIDLVVLKEAMVPANATLEAKKQSQELLNRESQMLFCLHHPNIAAVLDYFVEDDRHYLVLEYARGQDLKQFVHQHGHQKQETVVDWGIQIASILAFLHSRKPPIIHRDLTPDNLILQNDGTIMLIDFGIANEFIGTATGTMVGKQAYIAPEQLRGKANLQSDLYALGGTLHFLLTAVDPVPLSESHPRSIRPEIADSFDQLVAELTAFELERRITSANQALPRLKEVADFLSVKAK